MIKQLNIFREKFDMTNKSSLHVLLGVLLFVFSSVVNAAANVSFSENFVKSGAGNVFTLDIVMSDFPVTEGGGLVLYFDPALLQVARVNVDSSVWQFVNKNGDIDNAGGVVSGILFSSYQGVTGNAKIATIEFQAISKGKGEITIEESADNPFASNGHNTDVTFTPTKILIRR